MVLGTERKLDRRSWVVWQEDGKYPNVIVEILSDSTASVDRGEKKQIYQDIFRTPNYFGFDPESLVLEGFRLVEGQYQVIAANEQGWLWSQELGLYLGVYGQQLRYFTEAGDLVPTTEEAAILAQQQLELAQKLVEQERQKREAAEQKLLALQARLEALGIE